MLPTAGSSTTAATGLTTPTSGPGCPAGGTRLGTGTGTGTGTATGSTQTTPTPYFDGGRLTAAAVRFHDRANGDEHVHVAWRQDFQSVTCKAAWQYSTGRVRPLHRVPDGALPCRRIYLAGQRGLPGPALPGRCRQRSAGTHLSGAGLPPVSAVRPIMTPLAGAVALATALMNANVFQGQPPAFAAQMMQLAAAADASTRGWAAGPESGEGRRRGSLFASVRPGRGRIRSG